MSASFVPEMRVGASQEFRVCGVDEVGRGPLAGPVVAAAVHIPLALWHAPEVQQLQDSKKVPAARRAVLSAWIRQNCLCAVAEVSPQEIDRLNILEASLKAMAAAVAQLSRQCPPQVAPHLTPHLAVHYALIDGNRAPSLPIPVQTLVKGDAKSRSIAAASILAKHHRDQIMIALDAQFPSYGWAKNSGYPTAQHRAALAAHGPTCHHRATFRGVINVTHRD